MQEKSPISSEAADMLSPCGHCGRGGFPVDNVWIAVDLDGTILESGHYPKLGPPVEGAREALEGLSIMGFRIMVWTSRTSLTEIDGKFKNVDEEVTAIKGHLRRHKIPFDYLIPSMQKPALVYSLIDDRAFRFRGDWRETMQEIREDLEKKGVPILGDKRPWRKKLVM